MSEIIFAIINLIIGAFVLCYFGSDIDENP